MSDAGKVAPEVLQLAEGDRDPILKKVVTTLIAAGDNFIVYLDEDNFVQWHGPDHDGYPGSADVFNTVSHLETLSETLIGTEHLQPLRRLLGEAIARLYSYQAASAANPVLNKAERYLVARSAELARRWYLEAAFIISLILCIPGLIALLWNAWSGTWPMDRYGTLLLGVASGSLGALVSIILRTSSLQLEAGAGRAIHSLEACARIIAGAIGAVFIIIAIKADLLAGFISRSENRQNLLLFIAFCAGASERLMPSLIDKVGNNFLETKKEINSTECKDEDRDGKTQKVGE